MKGFRPLHDRVLLKHVEVEEKTSGGIIIPDTARKKPVEGEVLAVGLGRATCRGGARTFSRQLAPCLSGRPLPPFR